MSGLLEWAPASLAWERDNIGLLIGSADREVTRVLVCLDVTAEILTEAVQRGAQCIVAHHPLIFHPLKSIQTDTTHGALLAGLLRANISVIAMHTNADAARGGLNTGLAALLGIRNGRRLDAIDEVEQEQGIGVVGDLAEALHVRDFLSAVKKALGCSVLRCTPFAEDRLIRRVAVCSGAGSSYVPAAVATGADAFVTADLTHHTFLDFQSDILLVDAGHYETERLFISLCAEELQRRFFEDTQKIDILRTHTDTNPVWFT
ncbi:MAG: Nif3-like dinuclear metal center hexameric protein [Bacteroidetes bacterium]|nr:Nif3-like dinuclear metal center hexameric protein [Bacteroidota bacterium]